jgi:hypothetical protein
MPLVFAAHCAAEREREQPQSRHEQLFAPFSLKSFVKSVKIQTLTTHRVVTGLHSPARLIHLQPSCTLKRVMTVSGHEFKPVQESDHSNETHTLQ